MQELNLCYKFGTAYWKAACLTVDSGISDTDKGKAVDYGKIAEAVGTMRDEIIPVCINLSKKGFSVKDDKILYGLVGLTGVNETEAEEIISKRPFTSFNDFLERCEVSNKAIICLIKANAFRNIEPDRKKIAIEYIKRTTNVLKSLTTVQADSLVTNNMLPQGLQGCVEFNSIRKTTLSKNNLVEAINKTNGYYRISEDNVNRLKALGFTFEFTFSEDGSMVVEKTKFQNAFKKQTEPLTEFLKSEEALDTYNRMLLNKAWLNKFSGCELDWEMDSMRTYIGTEHKLNQFDLTKLPIERFDDIIEAVKIDEYRYKTHLIAGTVINSDKDKHTLSILTKEGVVKVKMSKQAFAKYNKVDSIHDGKTKVITEDTWFKASTHLVIQGMRDGQVFYAKEYKSSIYPIFIKILGKNINGETSFSLQR